MHGAAGGRWLGQIVQRLARLGVVAQGVVQKAAVAFFRDARQQRAQGFAHVGGQPQRQRGAAAQRLRVAVHLKDGGVLRVEGAVGKVGAQHQHRAAVEQRVVAR